MGKGKIKKKVTSTLKKLVARGSAALRAKIPSFFGRPAAQVARASPTSRLISLGIAQGQARGRIGGAFVKQGKKAGGFLGAVKKFGGYALAASGGVAGGLALAGALGRKRAVAGGQVRRRRGLVPKAVRKYIGKAVRRQKAVQKTVRKMLSLAGVKTSRSTGRSTRGVITAVEAERALRR